MEYLTDQLARERADAMMAAAAVATRGRLAREAARQRRRAEAERHDDPRRYRIAALRARLALATHPARAWVSAGQL